jgi:tRNA1(Val) A37 N6-methylase TrmN6
MCSTSSSTDGIFHGEIRVLQHRSGYRFTEDAVLLAAFSASGPTADLAVDLGAGCGVVGLILAHRGIARRVVAVEIQLPLARLADQNARENGLARRIWAVCGDLRRMPLAPGSVDLVCSNPPYQPLGRGGLPPDPERALARHEVSCDPDSLCIEAVRCLTRGGRLVLVYPVRRLDDVRTAIARSGLSLSRTRLVVPGPGRAPVLCLLEAVSSTGDAALIEEQPLCTRDDKGALTDEMADILAGRFEACGEFRSRSAGGSGARD